MCNLSGYSGLKKANINILKLLAIYGRERGTDGFGCWMGKKLYKHGGYQNLGDSYYILHGVCINHNRNTPNTVLMHNRSKSVGDVTVENAHPYRYSYIDGIDYVFAHNGTIKNIDALCEKYKVTPVTRTTDSYNLGKIIYETGFDVLHDYEGFAAFSLLDVNTDTLYLWKGFSQCESATPTEERPLNMYVKPNLLYYASEKVSLVSALNTDSNIESLPNNTLLTIVNGSIVAGKKYDRSGIVYKTPTYYNANAFPNYDYDESYYRNKNKTTHLAKIEPLYKIESSPQNKKKGQIYCWQTKYWKNGHLLNGIYDIQEDNKCYLVSTNELIKWKKNELLLQNVKYFYKGWMIKDEVLYNQLCEDKKNDTDYSIWQFSQFLHDNTIYIRLVSKRYTSYYNGQAFENRPITPLYSIYSYTNRNGSIEAKETMCIIKNMNADELDEEYRNRLFT